MDGWKKSIHPLMIDHVLERILTYASANDRTMKTLYSSRQVCYHWNQIVTKLLKKRFETSFGDHYASTIGKLEQFTSIMSNSPFPDKCFVRFQLHPELFESIHKERLLDFLTIMGPTIEYLLVHMDVKSDAVFCAQDLESIHFTKLRAFSFVDRRRPHTSEDFSSQKLLNHIITCSNETLEYLSVLIPREPAFDFGQKELQIIHLLESNSLTRLKYLKLDMVVTDRMLETLSALKLRLKGFHLSIGASHFRQNLLTSFLEKQRHCLEELQLTDFYRRSTLTVQLPKNMYKLKSLEIHGFELPAHFVSFPNFSYEQCTPALSKVLLKTWAPTSDWEVFMPKLNVVNNTVVHLSLAMNFDDPNLMTRVAQGFTHLRKLEMYFSRASAKTIEVVFKNMTKLEELTLHQSYLGEISTDYIDDILTGLSARECQWIRKNKAYAMVDLHQAQNRAGLINLENLKKFDIVSLRYRNLITDVSGYLVFLQMKSLQQLVIGCSELGEDCLNALAERFPNSSFRQYMSDKVFKPHEYYYGLSRNSIFASGCAIL